MSKLMACGTCCAILSIWGFFQLLLMGVLYKMECSVLIHDVQPHVETLTDYQAVIDQISKNYNEVSINCFIAAGIYAVTLILSILCCVKARRSRGGGPIKSCEYLDVEGGIFKIPGITQPEPTPKKAADEERDDLNETRIQLRKKSAEAQKSAGVN